MMKRTSPGVIGIALVTAVIILMVTLPVSRAGNGPQDGTGNQYGGAAYQQGGQGNGTCIQANCLHNGTHLHSGTGKQCGRSGTNCGNGVHGVHHGQVNAQQNRA